MKRESRREELNTNLVLVEQCRERGLEVIEDDIIAHLRGVPDESLGAVTGFHIIEHISIDTLVSLLDEVVRVLRPGGAAIFRNTKPGQRSRRQQLLLP